MLIKRLPRFNLILYFKPLTMSLKAKNMNSIDRYSNEVINSD